MKNRLLAIIDSLELFPLFYPFTLNRAAVLMMHRFCGRGERWPGYLPVDVLDACIAYLLENQYSVIPLSAYVAALASRRRLYKTVVLTVDDGCQDLYVHAYPVMRKYGVSAAVFLVSDFIDGVIPLWWNRRLRPLTWEQIREMKEQGMEFLPHTRTHPILAHCTNERMREEIGGSKRRIEAHLGTTADIFCYPNGKQGDFDDAVIAVLKEEGCRAAFTAEEGHDHTQKTVDAFRLKRYPFPDDLCRFKQLVSGMEGLKNIVRCRR